MANITVNLDVDNEQFQKLCVDNINDLPKEKLEEVLLRAVEVALIGDKEHPSYDSCRNILVARDQYSCCTKPTDLMQAVLKNIDTEKYFKPIADKICEYIVNNYKELVQEYMVQAITNLLFTQDRSSMLNIIRNKVLSQE